MTKKEKIIVSAYTGYLMCDFADMQKYIEEKLGRAVFTHELAGEKIMKEVREKVKPDFIELCKQKKTYVPLSKCSCGAKLSVKLKRVVYGRAYKCIECGLESNPAKTYKQARENWNKAVEKNAKI